MIFLSAQPDKFYFLWQLELQLFNFHSLGLSADQIHVLIGYDPVKGLSKEFSDLIDRNSFATFYVYPDRRQRKAYLSSIRPNIIEQHFVRFPFLSDESIFYHDSDVLFRELPDFSEMQCDKFCYLSDTRSYLDSKHINFVADNEVFNNMCSIVGVDPAIILRNDHETGGAQYLLNKVNPSFWKKVEKDCEDLYVMLDNYHNNKSETFHRGTKGRRSDYKGIQVWCADMWAMFYNLLLFGYTVRIHKELEFCWAKDNISKWEALKILHYSGVKDNKNGALFCKADYIHYPPYYEDFNGIDKTSCSYVVTELINRYGKEEVGCKIDLEDVTFVIPLRIDSPERLQNLKIVVRYLTKHFRTNLMILEADKEQRVNTDELPATCHYFFAQDDCPMFHRTRYNNSMITRAVTQYVVLCDTDVVLNVEQYVEATALLRNMAADMVIPYDGDCVAVDPLFKMMFGKLLDTSLLMLNRRKFLVAGRRAVGGAVFVNRLAYIEGGMENEYLESWGPEDRERYKRMEILGYNIMKLKGPLFHLPHPRGHNSWYVAESKKCKLMEEYLKICSMKRDELKEYVQTWEWVPADKLV